MIPRLSPTLNADVLKSQKAKSNENMHQRHHSLSVKSAPAMEFAEDDDEEPDMTIGMERPARDEGGGNLRPESGREMMSLSLETLPLGGVGGFEEGKVLLEKKGSAISIGASCGVWRLVRLRLRIEGSWYS